MIGLRVRVLEIEENTDTTPLSFRAAANRALGEAIKTSGPIIMEPIMVTHFIRSSLSFVAI
jgi:translation elongation factor EF-G